MTMKYVDGRCGPMRRWIIGLGLGLVLLLAGCSMVRLGYSQAPSLAYWWLDGYVDLDGEQSARARDALDQWFVWHRRSELPQYAALLARGQRDVMEPALTPEALCAWRDAVQPRLDAALEQAVPTLAGLLSTLAPEQLRHIERKLSKDGESLRADFLQADRVERAQASFKRTLERYETLYGRLDEAQRVRLAQLLAASSFDAERWLAERERRNRDLIAALTSLAGTGRAQDASAAQAQAAVRVLIERMQRSPRTEYRTYQERLTQESCALAASMHNIATAAQRRHARDKLKGWEDDVRALAQVSAVSAATPRRDP